ncbi:MAG: PEGA domain-containing protein [Sandaracinaceae bacterium]
MAGPAVARAQEQEENEPAPAPDTHPEDMERAQTARRQFMSGLEAFQEHRYRDAIQAFTLAAQLVPSADLWYNIARAHEELSEYEESIDFYQRYLRDRVDPPDRARLEQHIEALRERAAARGGPDQPTEGVLRLTANRADSTVTLDGASAGTAPWDAPRSIEAGRHRLALDRDGYIPFRSEVNVEAGMTTAAYADLVPETRYRAIRSDRIFTWVAFGFGVASLGVSIGLGVEALSRQDNLDDARTWAAFSDGMLGASIGFGVLGAILYFVEGRSIGTERITVEDEGPAGVRGIEE